jgi:ATP-dependent DNA helicase MPH1
MIRPHVFVGQAASKGSEGMDQKRQNAVIQDFKSGKYNCLIATSIGEEGLDIGTVDLIVCYDASSSPIRMLQRIGRTGRKRVGQVRLLLMKDKEEKDYAKAQDNYAYIQKTIADDSKYAYRDDQSPRILPKEIKPIPDKRPVDIPPENSQPIDFNERARKGRGKGKAAKRPPKKFHMPDNVRTGFVNASRLGSDDDGEDNPISKKGPVKKKPATVKARLPEPSPEPEIAPLPYLADVVLTDEQQRELETSYARTADGGEDALIQPIDAASYLAAKLVDMGPSKYIRHGRMAELVQKTMRAIRDVDSDRIQQLEDELHMSDLEDAGSAKSRLARPAAVPTVGASGHGAPAVKRAAASKKPLGHSKKAASPDPESEIDELEPASHFVRPAIKAIPSAAPARRPVASPPPPDSEPAENLEEPILPAVPFSRLPSPRPTPPKRKRAAPKKANAAPAKLTKPQKRAQPSYGSGAEEGASSSPPPTPTQNQVWAGGVEELGSEDTSGEEEEEEELDSELAAFIARSDEVTDKNSSQTSELDVGRGKGGRLKRKDSRKVLEDLMEESEEEAIDDDEDENEVLSGVGAIAQKGRRKRIVDDSDSDE